MLRATASDVCPSDRRSVALLSSAPWNDRRSRAIGLGMARPKQKRLRVGRWSGQDASRDLDFSPADETPGVRLPLEAHRSLPSGSADAGLFAQPLAFLGSDLVPGRTPDPGGVVKPSVRRCGLPASSKTDARACCPGLSGSSVIRSSLLAMAEVRDKLVRGHLERFPIRPGRKQARHSCPVAVSRHDAVAAALGTSMRPG